MSVRLKKIIPEIVDARNMSDAFDEVVGNLGRTRTKIIRNGVIVTSWRRKETNSRRRAYYTERKEEIITSLVEQIKSGEFRISSYHQFEIKEGGKVRTIQAASVPDRIGCNAVMRVVEKYLYPTIIRTSAASIKGKGMHGLYRKMRSDIRKNREETIYFYKCDIHHFYDSINQDTVISLMEKYIEDPLLLKMLIGFITMKEKGLSIGLRSSQFFGNILLSALDHRMKEKEHARYYYRYCDDIVVLSSSKKSLWRYRDIIHEEIGRLGLELKPNETVRPTTEGIDFLGFVDFGDHTRLRKRIKKNTARKLHDVRSRKRRMEIASSLKGMAKWGDCGHLYITLTGCHMKSFKELGLQYVAEDGKKRFEAKQVTLRSLMNIKITVEDYEEDVKTQNGARTLVYFQYGNGERGKYFTADHQQLWYLKKIKEMGEMPFDTTISSEVFGEGKVRYLFT